MPNCSARHPVVLVKHSESFVKDLKIVELERKNKELIDLVMEGIKLGECYDSLRSVVDKNRPSNWGSSFKERALKVIKGD